MLLHDDVSTLVLYSGGCEFKTNDDQFFFFLFHKAIYFSGTCRILSLKNLNISLKFTNNTIQAIDGV
jgi:hypothetical protein